MFSIEMNEDGYKIKVSAPGSRMRGYTIMAKNLKEVHAAIDHHFAAGLDGNRNLRHRHTTNSVKHCPFCNSSPVRRIP